MHFLRPGWITSRIGRNLLSVGSANAISYGLIAATVLLSTPLLNPEAFLVLGIVISSANFLVVLGTLKLDWSIPNTGSPDEAMRLAQACLGLLLLFCLLGASVVILTYTHISNWKVFAEVGPFVHAIPLFTFASGVLRIATGLSIQKGDLRPLAFARITAAIAGAGLVLALAWAGMPRLALVGGFLANEALAAAILFSFQLRHNRGLHPLEALRKTFEKFAQQGLKSTGVAITNIATLSAPLYIITGFYASAEAGLFAFAQRFIVSPLFLLTQPLAQTFWVEAADMMEQRRTAELKRLFKHLAKRLFFISLGLAAVILLFYGAAPVLKLAGTWRELPTVALLLVPYCIGQITVQSITHLIVHNRQGWQFGWELARLLTLSAGLLVIALFQFPFLTAILYLSLVFAAFYALLYCMNLQAINQRDAHEKRDQST